MCAYTLWILILWLLLGYVRLSGALRGTIPSEYLRVGLGTRPGNRVVDVHHHFSNQFEIPMLFYLGCLTAIGTGSADRTSIMFAWSFVGLRMLHTALVLIRNDPRIRVGPYVLSTFAVWMIWANLFRKVVWSGL